MLNEAAITFLEGRGLDPEIASSLGWGVTGDRLAIPYRREGNEVNTKYRNLSEKRFSMREGAELCLWNVDALYDPSLKNAPVIVTEGEFDALAAIQCGFPRTLSVPNGGDNSDNQGSWPWLERERGALRQCERVILALDDDEPGVRAAHRIANAIGRSRCYWVEYPANCKDLNEVLQTSGAGGVTTLLNNPKPYEIKGIGKLSDLPPLPATRAYSTGIQELDPHWNIRLGDFIVVYGIPGHGKSTFLNDVVCRVVEKYGWTVAIASFEQPPQTEHRTALRVWRTQAPEDCALFQRLASEADDWIDWFFVFITAHEDQLVTLDYVLERIETAAVRYGAKLVVVDPWNELDHDRDRHESETEYTGKAIKELKYLAKRLQIALIVVAHPSKPHPGSRLKCPTPYDISGSAHWYNKPDVCIAVWRDVDRDGNFKGTNTEIRVQKSRYWNSIGRPGTVKLWFDSGCNRYRGPDDFPEGHRP